MKKFGFKIALSCAALAASAATLATTTFAWYTSNAKVTASNITAGTSDTGVSTLQLSTKLAENYGTSIDFSNPAYQGTQNNNNLQLNTINELLTPVQYGNDGDGAFTDANLGTALANGQKTIFYDQGASIAQAQAGVLNNTGVANSSAVVNFSLFFKVSGAEEANVLYMNKFEIVNKNDSLSAVPVTALNRLGIPDSFEARNYTVDLLRALKIAAWSTTYTDGVATPAETDKKQVWGVNGFSKATDSIGSDAIGTSGWDAHKYLNDALGLKTAADAPTEEKAIADEEKISTSYFELVPGSGTSPITLGSIPAVTVTGDEEDETKADLDVLRVDFFIFLDGWDFACFDACQGQEFELDFGFALQGDAATSNYTI